MARSLSIHSFFDSKHSSFVRSVCPRLLPATAQTLAGSSLPRDNGHWRQPSRGARRPQDSLIVGVNLDAVSILVTARNTKGDYISSLKANDFQVLEDGDEQPISFSSRTRYR